MRGKIGCRLLGFDPASDVQGFLVAPSCLLALTLIVSTTVVQAALYGCSRGELQMLEVAAYSDLHFSKSQDPYVVNSDVSYQRAFVMATGDSYAKKLEIEMSTAGKGSNGSHQMSSAYQEDLNDSAAEVITVKLGEMSIPLVLNVSVEGSRPSQDTAEEVAGLLTSFRSIKHL